MDGLDSLDGVHFGYAAGMTGSCLVLAQFVLQLFCWAVDFDVDALKRSTWGASQKAKLDLRKDCINFRVRNYVWKMYRLEADLYINIACQLIPIGKPRIYRKQLEVKGL